MKLLIDQNLSFRLVAKLAGAFPGSQHVRDAGLDRADDAAVWGYARAEGLMILSKDDDFYQRSVLYGHPPKVIWVQLGNASTAEVQATIERWTPAIVEFAAEANESIMVISRSGSYRG